MAESATTPATRLTINQISLQAGQEIAVPIILEASSDITAFGFDLEYPQDALEFVGLERTDMTSGFTQLEANLLNTRDTAADALFVADPNPGFDLAPPDVLHYGALRVGGYKLTSTTQAASGVLVTIIFRVTGEIGEEIPIAITAVFDDLRNASLSNGAIRTEEKRTDARLRRTLPRRSVSKRYDF